MVGTTPNWPTVAIVKAELAALHHTLTGRCVKSETKVGAAMGVSTWGSFSALMGQVHIKAERNGGLAQLGPIFIILGQAHVTREHILSFKEHLYFSEFMGQAHFNREQVGTCFMMLMGQDKSVISPVRQWEPGGIYLSRNKSLYSPP